MSPKRSPHAPAPGRLANVFGDRVDLDSAVVRSLGRGNAVPVTEVAPERASTVGAKDVVMDLLTWYNSLEKPAWTPSPATIGLIWQILYPIILVTFGFVFVQAFRRKVPWSVFIPFAINLVANLVFTPIQFGLRNLVLASVDILIVWATIPWLALAIWRYHRWVAFAQIPYFAWVSTATILQLSITAMNR
ncbi:MAG: hypothetical protein AMXMBFR58_15810 [Phycisphaerae bacterium]